MLRNFRQRRFAPAHYRFFVWEGGSYVAAYDAEFASDREAALEAERRLPSERLARPASLDRPHMHVVRQDGVHIITLDLAEPAEVPAGAGGLTAAIP